MSAERIIPGIYKASILNMLRSGARVSGRDLLTDEQKANLAARRQAERDYREAWLTATSVDSDLGRVAALHTPVGADKWVDCGGCDYFGYEAEDPPWPCRTARLIGELLGVPE